MREAAGQTYRQGQECVGRREREGEQVRERRYESIIKKKINKNDFKVRGKRNQEKRRERQERGRGISERVKDETEEKLERKIKRG